MPYLTVERDDAGAPVLNPQEPGKYNMLLIQSDTGRLLPTIGLILEI